MAKQEWMIKGNCTKLKPEEADKIFFIGPGQSSKRARLFCATCPVKSDCANFAITYGESGIWAGRTDSDRKSLDPMIQTGLRDLAASKNQLESRNIDDFIPQQRHQSELVVTTPEPQVEQLAALVHPFEASNVPQAIGQ